MKVNGRKFLIIKVKSGKNNTLTTVAKKKNKKDLLKV